MAARRRAPQPNRLRGPLRSLALTPRRLAYFSWSTALAAAKRAIGTRNGEQLT